MSVVLLGYHNMGCRALKVLLDLSIPVTAVFTHRDSPSENIWFKSLSDIAMKHGIPVHYPDNINEKRWVELLGTMKPDILLSCYFRQMIGEKVLSIPRIASVNLHGSLLPKYRGRCPVNWQLVYGETVSGVTLHHMVRKADAGDIVGQQTVRIDPRDTAVTLYAKLEEAADGVLRRFLPQLLDGTAPRVPQDHSKATYFGGRRSEDGKIDWNADAQTIYNLIRAVTWPYPGAFSMLGDKKLFIWDAEPRLDVNLGVCKGETDISDGSVMVQTGGGILRLLSASFDNRQTPKKGEIPTELMRKGLLLK